MTSLVPLYAKQMFQGDAHFENTKIISSIYDEGFNGTLNGSLHEKVAYDGISPELVQDIKLPTFDALNKIAMEHSDAVVCGSEALPTETQEAFNALTQPTMRYMEPELSSAEMTTFYDSILEGKQEAVEG